MKHLILIQIVLGILLSTTLGCKTNAVVSSSAVYKVGLQYMSENPGKFLGKITELEGTYLGWSGAGCNYISNHAPQITRSDWTFRDSEGNCIFVMGGKPDFLNPMENSDTGKKIRLSAKLREDKDNKLYLQFVSAVNLPDNE